MPSNQTQNNKFELQASSTYFVTGMGTFGITLRLPLGLIFSQYSICYKINPGVKNTKRSHGGFLSQITERPGWEEPVSLFLLRTRLVGCCGR